MKQSTLETLAPLLDVLRSYSMLEEVRPTAFYLNNKDFIHFHEGPEGVYADVLLNNGRVSMPASNPQEQTELFARIEKKLSALQSHSSGNHRRKKRRR